MPYSSQPNPAQIFTLENGLQVIHQYLPATAVVVSDVWVRAGAIAEPREWEGMAHFLEHMIFKGSDQICPGEFDHLIENRGGVSNAATSYDYAHFFITTAQEHLAETLPYLGDILLNATIPDDEFIRERQVVLEEINISNDDPDWLAFQSLNRTLYRKHPYGRSILGEQEQLCSYSPNQMRCFHRTHYQPHNMTISVIGNIEADPAIELVAQTFAKFPVQSECPPFTVEAEPPLIDVRRSEISFPNLEMSRLIMGWLCDGIDRFADGVGLDVLSVILAGTVSSWLVQELREKRHLVVDISSGFSLQKDSSLFTVQAWLDGAQLDEVEKIIGDRLSHLHSNLVSEVELNRAKSILCNDHIFSMETPSQLAGLYGYYHTLSDLNYAHIYSQLVQRTTANDLQRLARQYLSPERYAVVAMKPA
ncbi:MAG: pitrilysin family protein [Limnothrix sp.]